MDTRQFVNVASHLPAMAENQPDALAVVVQQGRDNAGRYRYASLTALQLEEESNRLARGLQRIGVARGVRTVLMVNPSLEFFALTFALFKVGAVPVMVDPGMGIKNLKKCLDEARPEAFIGIPKAHAARVFLGWARKTIRVKLTVGPRLFWRGHTLKAIWDDDTSFHMALTERDETAAILFTSGSTGVPKGAVYTHGMFDAQVRVLRDSYHIRPGERDLATFPLFALFGPALGMAAIVPDMDASRPITADPENIVAAIHDFEATNLFASPALIEKVGRYGDENGVRLPSIKRVISAGAPADHESLRRFARLLDNHVPVMPSYGATEALPVCSIESKELIGETAAATAEGAGICVGRPVGEIDIKIVRITEDAIPAMSGDVVLADGAIGEICVRGPVVTREYFGRPEATTFAKIRDPETGGVYHRMGDLGYRDDQGRLWFCGRKAHRVQTSVGTLYTIPCERIFNAHPAVKRSALVGVQRLNETVPVLCLELNGELSEPEWQRLQDELLELGKTYEQSWGVETFLVHPGFPMDVRHNAKIYREQLAEWADGELA